MIKEIEFKHICKDGTISLYESKGFKTKDLLKLINKMIEINRENKSFDKMNFTERGYEYALQELTGYLTKNNNKK